MWTPPFKIQFTARGTVDYLMHRYDVDAVEAKSKLKKGDITKKTDDIES